MELAEGGDLFDKIESDVGVGEDIAHLYFSQLINAVSYMHSKKVSHRDIKPENILLSTDGYLKIADFGLAALFEYKGERKLCTSSCGSPPYTAPEVVTCDHVVKRKLSAGYRGDLVDIWSSAVVLFVLLVGNTPWDEPLDRNDEFREYLTCRDLPNDELWHKLPTAALPLLRGMMHVDPAHRWSLDDVQQNAWFRRRNPYISRSGRLENPIGLATEMFETMKIDLTQEPTSASQTQDPESHEAVDWESQDFGQRMEISSQATVQTNMQSWDERLADEPSCSQFSSTPRVPMTRTQFARQFHDILPSHTLARFFSFWSASELVRLLQSMLSRLGAKSENVSGRREHNQVGMQVLLHDERRCILRGSIIIETIRGNGGEVLEVVFLRTLGDPVEWRRFFKKMVVLCKAAVFSPDEGDLHFSQS